MNVLYDISALGGLWTGRGGLTGVPRVIENVLRGLLTDGSGDCRVTPCAPGSPYVARAVFRRDFPASAARLAPSPSDRWPGRWVGAADRFVVGSMARRAWCWRALRGALSPVIARTRPIFGQLSSHDLARADLYHSPHGAIPPWVRRGSAGFGRPRILLTVYDLIPFRHPEFFLPGTADAQAAILRTTDPEKDWYVCISEWTKRDLCELFKVDPSRVFVTPLAADPDVFHPCGEDATRESRRRYGLAPDAPYLMSLCTLEPRKNVRTVIEGFAEIVRSGEIDDLQLLLVGGKGWLDQDLQAALARWPEVRRRIILPGYVPDEDLAPLYSGALCFAYLSRYEGFGLPPLEAMQCGVPVLVANTSSLPEVVGDAGLQFAPDDTLGFAQSVVSLWRDPARRGILAERALARARQFSWARCARETVAGYRAMLAA